MLEEHPRRTYCARPRSQRLRGTTVPVQDGTGMEICNGNCACANRWIVPIFHPRKLNSQSHKNLWGAVCVKTTKSVDVCILHQRMSFMATNFTAMIYLTMARHLGDRSLHAPIQSHAYENALYRLIAYLS